MKDSGGPSGTSLSQFIRMAIVGPGDNQDEVKQNLIAALTAADVKDANERVIKSGIPYHHAQRL